MICHYLRRLLSLLVYGKCQLPVSFNRHSLSRWIMSLTPPLSVIKFITDLFRFLLIFNLKNFLREKNFGWSFGKHMAMFANRHSPHRKHGVHGICRNLPVVGASPPPPLQTSSLVNWIDGCRTDITSSATAASSTGHGMYRTFWHAAASALMWLLWYDLGVHRTWTFDQANELRY